MEFSVSGYSAATHRFKLEVYPRRSERGIAWVFPGHEVSQQCRVVILNRRANHGAHALARLSAAFRLVASVCVNVKQSVK